ncbi:MAG: GNAT family N-acetyltransferase, partial [Thermoplasmata archaeon]|nr:GNAT family N-acetyltransferase [Thermoplasmata archaeon]
ADLTWARIDAARARVRDGTFLGSLWVGPKDEAVGLASWDTPTELGRRITLYLAEGYRNAGAVRTFLARVISSEPGSPVLSIGDQIPQVDPAVQAEVLSPLGFFLVRRADMTFPADRAIPDEPPAALPPMRNLAASDEEAIAQLMARAYDDNPTEQALFAGRRDPLEDARDGAHMFLGEGLGEWLPSASFGVEENGRLIAATVVNDFHGPLLTEVMVEPAARRRGLATRLTRASVRAVRKRGIALLRLVVTTRNERAFRLYRATGWEVVPGSEGGVWLNLPAFGVPPPAGPTDG